jgi:hypothetical protein
MLGPRIGMVFGLQLRCQSGRYVRAIRSWPDPDGRTGASHRALLAPAALSAEQDTGAAVRAAAKQLSPSHPWPPIVSHHRVRSQRAEAAAYHRYPTAARAYSAVAVDCWVVSGEFLSVQRHAVLVWSQHWLSPPAQEKALHSLPERCPVEVERVVDDTGPKNR